MLLKDYLNEFTKNDLTDMARGMDLRGYSGLRKAALIDRIVAGLCEEEWLRSSLPCLTDEQLALFRAASLAPQAIESTDISKVMDAMQMCKYMLGNFDEVTDDFCIFEEIGKMF